MNLDDGGIYHGVFAVGIGIEGLKDLGENPAFNPTAVTLEHAVPVAKFGRQIAPWAAGTDNPQDGFDKETVIGCFAGVACLAAAQRLYFGPLGICQDISGSHGTMLSGNYVCQQALGCINNNGLDIELNNIVCLVGANNAGKTTILKAYERAIKQEALKPDDIYIGISEGQIPSVELWVYIPENTKNIDNKWRDENSYVRSKWEWDKTETYNMESIYSNL